MTIPIFGEKLENQDYQTRYGVYAIVEKENLFCLVQAPNGAFFLPGGEIEQGENHSTALKRELLEEIGADCQIGNYLGQADEYFYSSNRKQHFYNPAYIYSLDQVQLNHQPLEDFNGIFWFNYEEALEKLKRGSHKWGLKIYKNVEK
ncbi:MAG: NUDIX domain-containing protein [Lactovum sp.]